MRKQLGFQPRRGDGFDVAAAHFARQHHAREAALAQEGDGQRAVKAHLRRRVQRQRGIAAMQRGGQPKVLHDERVRPAERAQAVDEGERVGQLAVGHERVERDVGFDAICAAERKRPFQLVRPEIAGLGARVEGLCAEIDRVRSGVDGAAQRLGIARGRKQLNHSRPSQQNEIICEKTASGTQ